MHGYPLPSDTCVEVDNICKPNELKFYWVRSSLPTLQIGKRRRISFAETAGESQRMGLSLVYLMNKYSSPTEAFYKELIYLGS